MLLFRRWIQVAQFLPEWQPGKTIKNHQKLAQFRPESVAQFHPESVAQYCPELVAQFNPVYSLMEKAEHYSISFRAEFGIEDVSAD